ncbi:hypothetical protein J2S74_004712 [Evansella vedderi]|uniref:Phenylalanyl-tRNA synthetase subunit beta n=1 Tax=Evansella vedderi TaxID=38282 RepID=A0ABU0A198_9BACI|nr:hypothetical protein [Evansella vedderi]MDQ0257254.1 hypothetical protein [Evansella vedderi]
MKKFLVTLLILFLLGYGGYRFFITYATDEVFNQVSNELLTEEVVSELLADPEVQTLLEDFQRESTINDIVTEQRELPFHTKEEATKTILNRFSISEITDITAKATRGLTLEEQAELEKLVNERLSEEELEALLIIGLAELVEDLNFD